MSIYKRGCDKKGPNRICSKCGGRGSCGVYWYKFMWQGKLVRESTKQGNDKVARQMEAAHRTALAKGEVGIREKRPVPTLADFLKKDFLPFIEAQFAATKPKTRDYYSYGVGLLLSTDTGSLKINEITSQHAAGFAARKSKLSPSTVNCGLRTLRRALNLAVEWGKLDRKPKVSLAKGERQRERIVTDAEMQAYFDVCRQPGRDLATVLYGTAMRPGEAYKLRWEHVLLNGQGGFIQIVEGKSRAARRLLPMTREVYDTLLTRWELAGKPAEGWVFPAASASGHLEESSAKNQHCAALAALSNATEAFKDKKRPETTDWPDWVAEKSGLDRALIVRHADVVKAGLKPFQPYSLRHTALTRLAEAGCDAFTLARIAGHSSITITQRYCHPQAEAVERAFARLAGGHNSRHKRKLPKKTTGAERVLTANGSTG